MRSCGIKTTEILLPDRAVDMTKWAVIACDQFTSEPAYWEAAAKTVGDAPSTLSLVLPEVYLLETASRVPVINAAMETYLKNGILVPAVKNGFVLTERETPSGKRLGLVVALDLEDYDYTGQVAALTRATEQTVASRIPPRVKIRENAPLELPHVMVLIDDPKDHVIGALYQNRETLPPLYDFPLMLDGGHLRGWAVEEDRAAGVFAALETMKAASGGFLYAVGDGNHSLATAKTCWENLKQSLSAEERDTHPARYALVELVNLYSDALVFEPIHRVLFGADAEKLIADFPMWAAAHGGTVSKGDDIRFLTQQGEIGYALADVRGRLPLALLQEYLDEYLSSDPNADIDYVHGDDTVKKLVTERHAVGIYLKAIEKESFFSFIREGGTLPRKTFSMGDAREKRYYVESRKIR